MKFQNSKFLIMSLLIFLTMILFINMQVSFAQQPEKGMEEVKWVNPDLQEMQQVRLFPEASTAIFYDLDRSQPVLPSIG